MKERRAKEILRLSHWSRTPHTYD